MHSEAVGPKQNLHPEGHISHLFVNVLPKLSFIKYNIQENDLLA